MITSMFLVFVMWDPTNGYIMHTSSQKIGMYETAEECHARADGHHMTIYTYRAAQVQVTAMCIKE